MKKIFTLLLMIVSLSLSTTAYAQLRFGAKVGGNFSQVPLKGVEVDSREMTSFHAGLIAEFQLPVLPLSFEVDLLFSQRGSLFDDGKASDVLKSNHVDLPLYAKLWFLDLAAVRFYAQAGPYFSYRLSSNVDEMAKSFDKLKSLEANKIGMGINVGLGVELIKHLQISAQYSAALARDYEYKGVLSAADDFRKTKDKTFSVSLAFLF
ncbi:porin family protein [Porphyromonas sp.]|uniref:porin family protein n=1 Tax=Porphyromonas sp. TaxID=1924944 RepID=UPI0026DBACA8|nr:porin family protein [Porphyromonas sp.]MDO4695376.1 porin family protein [Porphyromonas sp.]MDO4770497.1 porin family protein [Porphyromonas sp.]